MPQRSRAPIQVRFGRIEFLKINAAPRDWRDGYHWVLSLTWPQFALFLLVSYITVNLSIETVMAASVQSAQDYSYDDIRWGERFVEIYEELADGKLQVDYGRIHQTEPVPTVRD